MDPIENTSESENSNSNGVQPPTAVKPWIAAGFKSRKEYRDSKRAAKGEDKKVTAKPAADKPKKPKTKKPKAKLKAQAKSKAKPSKKPVKVKAKTPIKTQSKSKNPYTAEGKRPRTAKSAARTAHFMKTSAKRDEPNIDEARILKKTRKGKIYTIEAMSEFFSGVAKKRKSMVRNALRWLRARKNFKLLGEGRYQRMK